MAKVNTFFTEQEIKAYLVGGFVRDALLGRSTADIDIAVAGNAPEIASRMADALGGKFIPLDEANGVGRVVMADSAKGQWHVDLSTIVGDIEQDLSRRDFTIDAIALDLAQFVKSPADASLIDPFSGRSDLQRGVIRATGETVFEADAARLLRAVRLAAELGFTISPDTKVLIQRSAYLVSGVAGERIREELLRILSAPKSGQFVRYLDSLDLLTAIIPELAQAKGVEQPQEHAWDVFDHSLETVRAVDFLLRREPLEYASAEVLSHVPWSERLERHFGMVVSEGSTRASLLKLAALLHDIAKPETKMAQESGRVRFFGHAEIGAGTAAEIMERLRFSGKEAKLVEIMVKYHLRPVQMANEGMPSHRAIYRYFRDTGDAGIDTLFLSLADHLAARGPGLNLERWKEHAEVVAYILAQRFQQESLIIPPKLIDGHDLINIFAMSPGPEIRRVLEEVREAQATGEVTTREEALSYVRNKLLYKRM